MIKTDLEFLEKDLIEVIDMFTGGENFSIRHIFAEKEDRVVNTIVVDGKSYAYGNLVKKFSNETERKRIIKRYAKLSLYKALSTFTGEKLPWGSLTGIRPTKLAYQKIAEEGEFKDFFIDTMKVSPEKTELTERVIENQKVIYGKDVGTDFFVFIPFCPSRCNYCSFITQDMKSANKLVDKYVETLIYEIEKSEKHIDRLRSIYIGGGTPVSLSDSDLEKVLTAIDKINTGVEYTVEAGRPDRITESNLKILKEHKVNRICINPQTFNDKTLKRIGRNHSAEDIIEKFRLAKNDFIINMDLIAGLDGESAEDFYYSVDKAIELSPDNITVHTLSVKKGAYIDDGNKKLPSMEIEKMIDYANSALIKAGYKPYYLYRQKYMKGCLENTGYCKDNKQSVYNIDVMEEISRNIACGAGAVSKEVRNRTESIERYGNPKDVGTYIEKIDEIIRAKEELFNQK